MSDGLVSKDLRARNAAVISEAKTFETHGVSRKAAMEFLRSPEGTIFRQRLIEADPGATGSTIVDRAIQQIGSGIELPRMELSADPLLKIVPAGQQVPSFSPFFARQSVFEEALASGKSLSGYFALPIKSEAPRYDIMVMRPLAPTEIFIHRVAPTAELHGLVNKAGGGEQALVPNRKLYEPPTYLKSIDDSLALRAERRLGLAVKGLGTGSATVLMALDAYTTAEQYQALSAQGNHFGADALLRRYEGRTAGGLLGSIGAGAAYGFMAGSEAGPGAFLTGAVGGVVGAFAGDRIAVTITEHKVNHQTGADGVSYVYAGGTWTHTHYRLDPDGVSVPNPYGAASMQAVVTTAPADQAARLDYQRMTAIAALALAHPATQDTRQIELDGIRWHATRTGWTQSVELPGLPNNSFGIPAFATVDRPADAQTARTLDQLAANRQFNNEHYAEDVAKAYVMDYYGKGWSAAGPLPDVVTRALDLPSEEHLTDPQTGRVWNADGRGHFSREETRLIGKVVIRETHGAGGEELARLQQLEQSAVRSNASYGKQLIAQTYEQWQTTRRHAPIERGAAAAAEHHAPPIASPGSDRAMFEALVTAARSMDIDAMRSVGRQYLQSDQGQAWLAAGQQLNQQLAQQAGREAQVQQAMAMQR